jgi:hypothetical protein
VQLGSVGPNLGPPRCTRERLKLVWILLQANMLNSVCDALDHMLDLIRLDRKYRLGLHGWVPAVMLRLDLGLECYDHVKWWATTGLRGNDTGTESAQ